MFVGGWLQKNCFTCARRLRDFYQIGEDSHDGLLLVLLVPREEGEGAGLLGTSAEEAGGVAPNCKLLPEILWGFFAKVWKTYLSM